MEMKYKKLTPEEEDVIADKGTERPFSGKFWNFNGKGIYTCKRCSLPLYKSEDKFDFGCGWPSFDDEIPGAVKRAPDPDRVRTEIRCANCGAHLGHVFSGGGMTPKDTRHCVNSISLDFKERAEDNIRKVYFAGGCFWGVEYHFRKVPGVISTRVGYMGGKIQNPSYEEVSSGSTGHAETLQVVYDEAEVSFEELAKLFFEIHDPTQKNRQGPDVGEQYRSAIFYTDERQKKMAQKLIKLLRAKGIDVLTELAPATTFYEAEEYHQKYYAKNSKTPDCHTRRKIF